MVCVGAAEGLSELFPAGTKQRSAMSRASGPEIRITASPPSPRGVEIAAMVSSSINNRLRAGRCLLQVCNQRSENQKAEMGTEKAADQGSTKRGRNYLRHFPHHGLAETAGPSGSSF